MATVLRPFFVDYDNLVAIEDPQILAHACRINCLAGILVARHGWIGGCFSVMEILVSIYLDFVKDPSLPISERPAVFLSKGHAAAAQYAVLSALGAIPVESLWQFKEIGGLPAHCDRRIPGVDSDSGSLGMGLSKGVGMAISRKVSGNEQPVFVILGDGELQEGQLFEAFLTYKRYAPLNLVVIVDRNRFQTDSKTSEIKDADNWEKVFEGIGLKTYSVNGHDIKTITDTANKILESKKPSVIIANTTKGYGSLITAMPATTPRRHAIWHSQVPTYDEYSSILKELVGKIDIDSITEPYHNYNAVMRNYDKPPKPEYQDLSTGRAFTNYLLDVKNDTNIFVLDADLEKSCKLVEVAQAYEERYVEVGISEQDMCSIASGIALEGKIAVVNTYASFYKRAIDQIFAAAEEGLPVIFAGHYAGLDYYTDGKTHQSLNDIGLIRSLGDTIDVYEPIDTVSTRVLLEKTISSMKREFAASGRARPAYFRLHRMFSKNFYGNCWYEGKDFVHESASRAEERALMFVSGPHMTSIAYDVSEKLAKEDIALDVIPVAHFLPGDEGFRHIESNYKKLFTLEDGLLDTGFGSYMASILSTSPVRIGALNYTQSARSFEDHLEVHSLQTHKVLETVKAALTGDE